ncbi:MAG: hypothetical protein JW814_12130 [Candidatus Krumholzibacteriota bacterium]|nr:hypothetical protein [Candidatus Krumholzibacteriota bacterium]
MQKGKGLCNTFAVRSLTAMILLSGSFFSSDLYCHDHLHSWNAAAGGVTLIRPYRMDLPHLSPSGSMGLLVSACQPYSIAGLSSSRFDFFYSTGAIHIDSGMGSLRHALYHEQLFNARISLDSSDFYAGLGIDAGLLLKRFSDSGSIVRRDLKVSLSFVISEIGHIVLRVPFRSDCAGEFHHPPVSVMMILRPLLLFFDLDYAKTADRDHRAGLIMRVEDKLDILSGYRLATGEVSGGILYSHGKMILSFSCSSHPVLGETFYAGVARMWR